VGKVILSKSSYAERKNQEPKLLRRCAPTTPLWKWYLERQTLLRDRKVGSIQPFLWELAAIP